ncbi:tyrosine-type recombinase/integrase [Blautia sp.]|uniref:tyrosine-type recombinase/integrase n=1 Tax=Blautia sp. TaxID=1955243 RepID=UPI0025869596|nr:tyrosine-type recombinase/integrase [Blautia sp.]
MDFILKTFAAYMDANALDEYTPEIGDRLIQYCEQELKVCPSRVSRAKVIVRKLNRLQQGLDGRDALWGDRTAAVNLPSSLSQSLDMYISYCRSNGNKQTTLHYKQWILSKFLGNLSALGCEDIRDISGQLIQKAFLQLGFSRYWERVAPFLRFLFEHGTLGRDYSKLVQYRRKNEPQPTVYTTDEISAIEDSIDRTTPVGIRNFAIVLLLSRYGIRSRDIAALTFENINFTDNRIHFIQQKTGDPWESELLPEAKEALLDYINKVRPEVEGCQQIFMTLVIPYTPMDYGAINTMVGMLLKNAGIPINGRRHGSRAFRSSIASNMINDNVSTEVVRRVLGHGTKHAIRLMPGSTSRACGSAPLEVPAPSGSFAELLSRKDGGSSV